MSSASGQPPREPQLTRDCDDPVAVRQLQQEIARLQSQLKATEQRYQQLLQTLPHLIWITDAQGASLRCSPSWQVYLGVDAIANTENLLEFVHPDDRDRLTHLWQAAQQNSQPQELELRLRQADGTYHRFWLQHGPVVDAQGQLRERVSTFTLIDRVQQSLPSTPEPSTAGDSPGQRPDGPDPEEQQRFRDLLTQIPAGVCYLEGPDYVHAFVNPCYQKLVGDREVIGRSVRQVWPYLMNQRIWELLDQVYRTGEPCAVHGVRIHTRSQTGPPEQGRWEEGLFDLVCLPIRDATAAIAGILVHAVDITEQVLMRNRLQELAAVAEIERDRLQQVLDVLPEGLVLVDPDGQVILANQAAREITGLNLPSSLVLALAEQDGDAGQGGTLTFYRPDGTPYEETDLPLSGSIVRGEVVRGNQSIIHNATSGVEIPVLVNSAPLRNVNGEIVGGIAVFQDVSELKQIEAELRLVNEILGQFKSTLDLTLDGVFMLEPESLKFSYVNQGMTQLLEHSKDRILRLGLLDIIPEQDCDRLSTVIVSLRRGRLSSYRLETTFHTQASARIPVELSLQFVAPPGEQQRFIGIARDIRERQQVARSRLFMTEASTLLSASLDYETTLQQIARLSVDYLADLCMIDLVKEDGSFQRLALAHMDPRKEELLQELRNYPPSLDRYDLIRAALQTERVQLAPHIPEDDLRRVASDSHHFHILQQLNLQSVIVAPLSVQGRILGALSLFTADSGRTYDEMDMMLAEDLARRAALAVENARLYRQAQDASDRLRRAIVVLGEQQQQLRTLQRLTNLLNQRLADLPGLLRVMVNAVYEAIPAAEFALIVLQNPQTGQLELTSTAGKRVERFQTEDAFEVGEGFIGQVFATGAMLLLQAEPAQSLPEDIPLSLCAVPIESAQAGRLGVLAIGSWQSYQAFDSEEQQLLIAFGEQAAIALNNAQLIKALEEREKRLEVQNELLARQNLELEQQRQQIQRQNIQLQEVSRLKSQFLATMSHELRTPMNAIIGFSQLLLRQRQPSLPPPQTDMVTRILNNGKNLLALINDILDLSKIEAGRLELNMEEFQLDGLVRSTADELRSLAAQKRLKLQVRTTMTNPMVMNDRKRLRQVLVNLISNAIKFTETGEVTVTVSEPAADRVLITVEDTGIGIAQEELQHIFQEFRQVDQTTTRRYPGTGLGLAISDWLVQMMNGSIHVESEVGQGSVFRVELPRHVDPVPPEMV